MKLPVPNGGKSILWAVVTLISVVFVLPNYSLAQSTIAFSADFETSNIRSGWDWMEACCSHSMTQSFDYKRTGNSSLRVELRKSDGTQGGSKRAELSENNNPFPNNPNLRYYAFSHYLPADFKADSVQEILFQWHIKATSGITLGASPPLSLMIHKGNWELGINYDSTDINIYRGKNFRSKNFTLGPWERGKWTDWVIRYEYSAEDDGLVQVWKNQQLIFEYRGKNFYKGSYPPYMKMGIYKWSWSDTYPKTSKQSVLTSRVIYVDHVRFGTKDAKASDFFIDPPAVPNQAPSARISTTTSIQLPTNSVRLDGSGSSDPDGNIVKYQWSQVSGPSTATLTNATTAIATAGGLVAGTYQFRLTITDDKGATAVANTSVVVSAAAVVNKAPIARITTTNSIQLPTNSVRLDGSTSSDADGNIAKYQWSQVSGPSTASLTNATTSIATAASLIAGTYQFRLTVTDDKGATASSTSSISVAAAAIVENKKPLANAGPDQSYQASATSFSLNGSGSSDPDGTLSAFSWKQISGPGTSVLATPAAAITSVSNFVAGTYQYELTVTDNKSATDKDTVIISIIPTAVGIPQNQAPKALTDGDKQIRLPQNSVQLDGSKSSDADGRIAAYQWTQLSGPSTATIGTPNTAGTSIQNLRAGTYSFQLKVTDNGGLTATAKSTVTVLAAYQKPVANAGTDKSLRLPISSAALDGSLSSDPNGLPLTYTWKQIGGPTTSNIASASSVKTTASNFVAGTYQYTLTVKNTANLQAVDTVQLVILAPLENKAPVVVIKDSMLSNSPWRWQLNGSGSNDPDGRIQTYSWSFISGPITPIISTPGQAVTEVTNLIKGVYKFNLAITDNQGKSSVKEHSITVGDTSSTNQKENLEVRYWPNPVRDQLKIRISGNDEGYTLIRIFDVNGSKLMEQVSSKFGRDLQLSMNVQQLRYGTYFLSIKVGNNPEIVRKFMKL